MRRAEPEPGGAEGPTGVPYTHEALIGDDPVADALSLPPSRGVLLLLAEHARPVFMAATADCRALARRRLAPADVGLRAGMNLRDVVREARAVECGSAFEADLVYLLLARRLLPGAAKLVADRWRSWWAHIDPAAEFPDWTKTDLHIGGVAPRSASGSRGALPVATGSTIGPFGDKDAAGRFIEQMIDAFDLCREHRLLVLAPHAQPCPYKEMARCPAPCDGSEPMASYRARVRAAVDAATEGGIASMIERAQSAMRAAAASRDFEAAARHKAHAERLAKLNGPAMSRIGLLEDFRFLLVWRGVKPGWARVAACARGRFRWIADVRAEPGERAPREEIVELCRGACAWIDAAADLPMNSESIDVLGLLARERVAPDTRRTAWFVPVHRGEAPEVSAHGLLKSAAAAVKRSRISPGGDDEAEGPVHSIEALAEPGEPESTHP